MNPESMPTCDLHITTNTLSAWRDDLLKPAHAAQMAQHVPFCDACQQRLAAYDAIAALLRRQRELEPGSRISRAVHANIKHQRKRSQLVPRNKAIWGAAIAAALLVIIFAGGLHFFSNRPPVAPTTPETITVPTLVGKSYGSIKSQISQFKFQLDIHFIPSTDAQQGEILSQSPPPNTKIKPGTTVTINVGGGADFVLVPDVVGMTPAQACTALENAGLQCMIAGQQVQNAAVAAGLIAKTDPPAGTGVFKTSSGSVVLYISSGNTTPGSTQTITVQNPTIAAGTKVIFVAHDDVWLSIGSGTPQQLTHLNLQDQQLTWSLAWSPDQTKVLAVATTALSSAPFSQGWIIALPAGAVTHLPATDTLFNECGPCAYTWINDRLVDYINPMRSGSHEFTYQIFDTVTQQVIKTPIDSFSVPYAPIAANGQLYIVSASGNVCQPSIVERYNPATNQMVPFATLLGSAIAIGMPEGGIDVSADGQTIFASVVPSNSGGCSANTKYVPYALQRADGTVIPLFASLTQQHGPLQPYLSSDAKHAAIIETGPTTSSFAQEDTTTKQIYYNQVDNSTNGGILAAWFGKMTPGLYEAIAEQLPDGTANGVVLEYAPLDSNDGMLPVMKLNVQAAVFAQN